LQSETLVCDDQSLSWTTTMEGLCPRCTTASEFLLPAAKPCVEAIMRKAPAAIAEVEWSALRDMPPPFFVFL
jgi:hypothetical protein